MNKKITELTETTTVSGSNVLAIVTGTESVPETQKITINNLKNGLGFTSVSHTHTGGDGGTLNESSLTLSDVTTLNADTSKHGLLTKVSSTAGQKLITTGSQQSFIDDDGGLSIILGDGVNTISTGVKGFMEVPVSCAIESWRIVGDTSGCVVVDIWKDTYANFPPTVADTISGSATKPTLTSAQKAENTTLSGWTTTLNKGDWLGINVDSASTLKQVTLSLLVRKTATS
jgi:hypothetical protein